MVVDRESSSLLVWPIMSVASIRTLRFVVPLAALCACCVQLGAIFSANWLFTMELIPNENFDKLATAQERDQFRKYTASGLWQICYNDPPESAMHCHQIDHLHPEEYVADPADSTAAIPYSIRQSGYYFVISTAVLCIAVAIYIVGRCMGHRLLCTFISGVAFILSGLSILAGIVVYISTFKGEVSQKLRPKSEFQEPIFHYRYGYSFLLLVLSLIFSELSGTLAIFLYISQRRFQIMIDLEREEVLKKNILTLLAPAERVLPKPDMASTSGLMGAALAITPIFRLISDDDEILHHPNQQASSIALMQQQQHLDRRSVEYSARTLLNPSHQSSSSSPFDSNFLSPEYLYYGRHGSRGRRGSRSDLYSPNASHGGDESRKNSFVCGDEIFPAGYALRPTPTSGSSSSRLVDEPKSMYELNAGALIHSAASSLSRPLIAQSVSPTGSGENNNNNNANNINNKITNNQRNNGNIQFPVLPSGLFHTSASSSNILGLAGRAQRRRPMLRAQFSLDHEPAELREFQHLSGEQPVIHLNGSSESRSKAGTSAGAGTTAPNHRRLLTRQTTFV